MPHPNVQMSYFVKNEASYSFNNKSFGDYTMLGAKRSSRFGNLEIGLAFKATNSSLGGFGEAKYTSPKLGDSNWSIESRTRILADTPFNKDDTNFSLTQRIAGKGSWNLGKGWNVYEIAGANAKVSLEGKGFQSVTPTSITGIGYNVNKNLNVYAEGEISKSYNIQDDSWGKFSPAVYLGAKYTF